MTVFGTSRLDGVHNDLVNLVYRVGERRDIVVIQGARSLADELEAIRTHHSALKDPMNSKHVVDPDTRPLALAVDLGPHPLDWNDKQSFVDLALVVKSCANEFGIPIVWGGDFTSIKDYDHFELKEA